MVISENSLLILFRLLVLECGPFLVLVFLRDEGRSDRCDG